MRSTRALGNILKNEALVKFVFSSIPTAISVTTDKMCKRIIHNPEAAKIFRLPDWDSLSHSNNPQHPLQLYHKTKVLLPEAMPIQIAMWQSKVVENMEIDLIWTDGVKKTVTMSSVPLLGNNQKSLAAVAVTKDVTEVRKVERDLRSHKKELSYEVHGLSETIHNLQTEIARFDKLDLIGEMAASLAHEVRNPLTIVKGYLQMFLLMGGPKDPEKQYKVMIKAIDHANNIITNYLKLTKDSNDFKECNLYNTIEALFPLMVADGLQNDIVIEKETIPTPPLMLVEQEIRQLLINLVRNGIQAMPPGKTLRISTYVEGEDVVLSVADQGEGIPLENRDKIGQSFFTTKENGTGVGLAVCYRIAEKHKAKITFTSTSDGTTFYVKFKLYPNVKP